MKLLTGVVIGAVLALAGRVAGRVMQALLSVTALAMIYVFIASGPDVLVDVVQSFVAGVLLHPAVLLGAIGGFAAFQDKDD